jgi:hypothetical protein
MINQFSYSFRVCVTCLCVQTSDWLTNYSVNKSENETSVQNAAQIY